MAMPSTRANSLTTWTMIGTRLSGPQVCEPHHPYHSAVRETSSLQTETIVPVQAYFLGQAPDGSFFVEMLDLLFNSLNTNAVVE